MFDHQTKYNKLTRISHKFLLSDKVREYFQRLRFFNNKMGRDD